MCISPGSVPRTGGTGAGHILVPCGKCPPCLRRRAAGWVIRLQHEQRRSETSRFLTLTYEDDKLHYSPSGIPTLNFRDYQNFMKKLRKVNSLPIRYYAVGEYGELFQRPHFHAIMFNCVKTVDELTAIWGNGIVDDRPVTVGRMAYVAGYVQKKLQTSLFDRTSERSMMSKHLGDNFLSPEVVKYYQSHSLPYLLDQHGSKQPMPRYYRDKMYDRLQRSEIANSVHEWVEDQAVSFHLQVESAKQEFRDFERKSRERTKVH